MADRLVCGFVDPPEDGTADREQLDRFRDFLRIVAEAPLDADGRFVVTEQTLRYARGEDVPPVPVEDEHGS